MSEIAMPATRAAASEAGPAAALRHHWPEYACEAAGLGLFLLSACVFTALLEHPMSGVHQAIGSPLSRRALMGLAMGGTALAIVLSPMGRRSGAHLNPALTLTFWMLGKVRGWDVLFYVLAQFAGGAAGVLLAGVTVGAPVTHSAVRYAVTVPGAAGVGAAFAAEFAISFLLMLTVLAVTNHRDWSRYAPWFAAALIALYITVEAPLSGMSMNPARTVASAFSAHIWTGWWIYWTAPVLGMSAAARLYRGRVLCAKLHHHNRERCIFRCRFGEL